MNKRKCAYHTWMTPGVFNSPCVLLPCRPQRQSALNHEPYSISDSSIITSAYVSRQNGIKRTLILETVFLVRGVYRSQKIILDKQEITPFNLEICSRWLGA